MLTINYYSQLASTLQKWIYRHHGRRPLGPKRNTQFNWDRGPKHAKEIGVILPEQRPKAQTEWSTHTQRLWIPACKQNDEAELEQLHASKP